MLNFNKNLILAVDSYKVSHWSQFPEGTEYTQYYVESRGGKYNETMLGGVTYLVKCLEKGISVEDVEEANELFKAHFGKDVFNYEGWMTIATELGGKLPLKIRAPEEGLVVPTKNVLLTVENTDPRFGWLAGHFETFILRGIWYMTTVATESFEAKKIITKYINKTVDDNKVEDVLPFKLHDFGSRGISSGEGSALGGTAHLYNFKGTDNVEALLATKQLYGCDMGGFSIPAREHSTTTIYQKEGEDKAFLNSINQWGEGLYACVMDSYDYEAAVERVTTGAIKDLILSKGGTFVIRPDSGNPVDVVIKALEIVSKNVGHTVNEKGYKVLHDSYRVIQGDGVDTQEIGRILDYMEGKGWSAENVAFGMGGGLLQHMDRDTQRFAMKCSVAIINGEVVEVFKAPKTDMSKASKKGFLDLVLDEQKVPLTTSSTTCLKAHQEGNPYSVMATVFENGVVKNLTPLDYIRLLSDVQSKKHR